MKGKAEAVRRFAELLCAQRGVRHGSLNLISVELHQQHRHAQDEAPAVKKKGSPAAPPHLHMRPAH